MRRIAIVGALLLTWAAAACSGGDGGDETADMFAVPAGSFWRGCNEAIDTQCQADEYPYAEVALDGFSIDRLEVTQAAYEACVVAGECTAPVADYDPIETGNHPVRSVTWDQARTFCLWADKDLPTEAQWEKAARGTLEYIYPWGNDAATCALAQNSDCDGTTIEVGSLPAGASPSGALDMAGNVLEWVRDWYDGSYYSLYLSRDNPTGPETGTSKVFRGGGFDDPRSSAVVGTLRTSDRFTDVPSSAYGDLGFRCVTQP